MNFHILTSVIVMKTIYKSEKGKQEILNFYDSQLSRLKKPWKDVYVETSFGRTHIIETGDFSGEPLLVFHGGNATTAYNLLACDFIMHDFHIYAVDMVGHPGKSAQTSLPAKGYAYGRWVSEVIGNLGYEKISLFGGSFGAGDQQRKHDAAHDRILDHRKRQMAEKIHASDHIKVKTGMPSNVDGKLMRRCSAPTLVMAAEKDCLFPGEGVIKKAQEIIPACTTYLLKGRGHMNYLTEEEKKMIVTFLLS